MKWIVVLMAALCLLIGACADDSTDSATDASVEMMVDDAAGEGTAVDDGTVTSDTPLWDAGEDAEVPEEDAAPEDDIGPEPDQGEDQ